MCRNILLTMQFDGSKYHGWQRQKNAITVQQKVEEAIDMVFHEGASASGCSRTDSGVHALMFCCNFFTEKNIPIEKIPSAVNAYLPEDIAVFDAKFCSANFHARFSCKEKEYVYRLINTNYRDPFWYQRAYFYPYAIDADFLNQIAQSFLGRHDFSAFCSSGSAVKDKYRHISEFSVKRNGPLVEFSVRGDGFLYNMVRIMVGTLLSIQQGKIDSDSIPEIITSKNRDCAGFTAPPQGLYLKNVFYETKGGL